ncbi:uncharacterized protein TEOVI_000596600 [Trypanosoma equiperdum]|uniref:Uncharacterized protein n=4 Tax=Trypanozoon TaxID=39700 RepID=Q587D4_TRYB2|nr:hypothetical protein, conserved [Trypanosoma brucei gambiense DAL972]XP_845585.1 hypothetical protein, conserved [Trypanosoma brucei brucei TREU927]AAX79243.1 hypothetical protein, conserved [Trypanosoma brucei]RHW71921.1 hypothetical protein DPX39_060050900 [Trypanosoma brucei equiperdum]SCU66693.1 hypothetical protein, conserved [Trypanosoma equiperdum]AAZ12026.1 hypothetical protein, conserved [Trypanosoma brucei brucei TREU927]CBH11972.1 hypothetical protein, conserved [Trypanosoma bru|eukprot:XP_011774257.1 hypothetical protein, conserved [Trypanosoma brucei gambiense DAL972]
MESFKGLARRVTQSVKEKVSNVEPTEEDEALAQACKKVRQLEKVGKVLEEKFVRASMLIEELSGILKEIGLEYMRVPDVQPESEKVARDLFSLGNSLLDSSVAQRKELKEDGTDMLSAFLKNVSVLDASEESYRKFRLEHNFQREKVWKLRRAESQDSDRLIRNECKLEDWHVKLWTAGEKSRAACSQLYYDGRTSIDLSVMSFTKVLSAYFGAVGTKMNEMFSSITLPTYSTEPLLPPTKLPPSSAQLCKPPVGGTASVPEPDEQQQNQQVVDSDVVTTHVAA